ncbi:MAG TPA: pyrimidine-nucleoside phosphorylase, partial [Verrucomicrobiae bacterium]|nr:pyrimidine-nucleoside phosphorylase [Verrucomicrobiae bacterium]
VNEAIKSLQGKGPRDLEELCLALGSEMLVLSGLYSNAGQASLALKQVWESGAAFEKFKEFVLAQGGDTKVVDQPELLPAAKYILPVLAEQAGYVASIDAEMIGRCAMLLGAGRKTKESPIDLAVGLVLDKKVGSKVSSGDVLAYVHVNDSNRLEPVLPLIKAAYGFMDREPEKKDLIYRRVASPN